MKNIVDIPYEYNREDIKRLSGPHHKMAMLSFIDDRNKFIAQIIAQYVENNNKILILTCGKHHSFIINKELVKINDSLTTAIYDYDGTELQKPFDEQISYISYRFIEGQRLPKHDICIVTIEPGITLLLNIIHKTDTSTLINITNSNTQKKINGYYSFTKTLMQKTVDVNLYYEKNKEIDYDKIEIFI